MSEQERPIIVGITQGDFNGVGTEVIMKAFMDPLMLKVCTPIIYGSSKVFSHHKKELGITDFNLSTIKYADQANAKNINIINCWDEEVKVEIGTSTALAGQMAFKALDAASNDLKSGKIDAIVTAPINKQNIQSTDFKFAGHTEFFAERFAVSNYLMLMVSENLKIGTVTGHLPLGKASGAITIDEIVSKALVLNRSLIKDFGIRKPKIAVLGINPHAGDNGLLGDEEQKIIIPAVNQLKERGVFVMGPYAADGYFGSGTYKNFDATLAMYHDQGLIPFKTLSFGEGVNFTAGLPVVRTSPDHGTGYDIAGKNQASESSIRQAIYLAVDIVKQRKQLESLTSNPLKISNQRRER